MSNRIAPDDATLQDYIEPLAADLANALAEEKKAKRRADEIKDELRGLLEPHGPGDYPAGLETIRVTVAHTIDAKAVERDYPASTHPFLYTLKPDTKLVRAHLDEEQLEKYLNAGAPRIGLA